MYVFFLKLRCAEMDSETFLIDLCYIGPMFMQSMFVLVKGGGGEIVQKNGSALLSHWKGNMPEGEQPVSRSFAC